MRERIKYKYQLEQDFQLPTGWVMSHVLRVWASFPHLLRRFLHDPFASGFYRDMIFTYCFPYYCTYSLFIFVFKNKMHYCTLQIYCGGTLLVQQYHWHLSNSIVLRRVKCCQGRWGKFWDTAFAAFGDDERMEFGAWCAVVFCERRQKMDYQKLSMKCSLFNRNPYPRLI